MESVGQKGLLVLVSMGVRVGVFKKRGYRGGATTAIIKCPVEFRQALVERGKVYIGWQVIEVCGYISVTCCNKCELYGHPEKYCWSTETICDYLSKENIRKTSY